MEIESGLPAIVKKLEGKVALITGGASGIGECTARLFVLHGAKVVVADIQGDLGNTVCTSLGSAASFIHCDVSSEDDIAAAVDHAVTKYGKLDIMFNNAGVTCAPYPSILDKEDFEKVLAINLVGPFLGTKHAARAMIPARRGSIIATSSIVGCIGGAATHAYTCAKHGVVGLTKNAASELGKYGIRVNCVSPAGVATPLARECLNMSDEQIEGVMGSIAYLKGVVLRIEDVANAVLFLASDDSRYISGHNMVIDGGHSIHRAGPGHKPNKQLLWAAVNDGASHVPPA